ncbi:MAG: glucose-1-phosphate thymidylyltransferase, partial [Lentisphaeria bacterium]|nr:glucose-1-phosphate thymidylyltransferase [Lentisphaeria bacterium]
LNRIYLNKGTLNVQTLSRGFAWLDTGTHAAMSEATNFMKVIEDRQGLKVACIEEIVWKLGYINDAQMIKLGNDLQKSSYGKYLLSLVENNR